MGGSGGKDGVSLWGIMSTAKAGCMCAYLLSFNGECLGDRVHPPPPNVHHLDRLFFSALLCFATGNSTAGREFLHHIAHLRSLMTTFVGNHSNNIGNSWSLFKERWVEIRLVGLTVDSYSAADTYTTKQSFEKGIR